MSVVIELPRDINKLCRTCMKVADDSDESFEHKIVSNNQLTELSRMLENVTSLKIGVNDGLPETLCSQCTEYLNVAYVFRSHCENVDKDLRELLLSPDSSNDNPVTSEHVENKLHVANIEAETAFSCHTCLQSFKSEYDLSMHVVEHNKNRNLTERFKDNRHEIKPVIGRPESNIYDQIIERKLYGLTRAPETSNNLVKNETYDIADADSVESRMSSDMEETSIPECNSCGMCFQFEGDLASHVCRLIENKSESTEEITNETIFKCPLCSKIHSDMVSLSIHFLKHAFTLDISAELIFCETCGQIFDKKDLLKQHYQESTCKRKDWICSDCDVQFETECLLIVHNSSYHKLEAKNEGKLPCILCDEHFITKDNLTVHTLAHLMKRYICKECSICFCTQQAYFQHLKFHPGYQYTCIICGQLSKTKHALKSHVIGVHSEEPAYTCNVCNKSFKTPGRLKTHSHIHEERKNHMCSYCGYTAHKSGDLQIHIRSHTSERPYKCTITDCTKTFKTSSHLCSHLRRHLNIRNYICSICGVSFGTNHSLKIHHMLHTGEKPHQCVVCSQYFRRKYHLKVHMKQHAAKTT